MGLQGIVNIKCRGMPKASAQCIWAKLGGLAIIASATNGMFVSKSGSIQDLQQPSSMVYTILRFCEISPLMIVSNFGIIPGFLTMYCEILV